MLPLPVMLTICSSKIDLHFVLHNFTIETREMCESPGIKCASLPLYGNSVNASVNTVFYGSLVPHAEEKKHV